MAPVRAPQLAHVAAMMFGSDSAESFLAVFGSNAALRHLGSGFQVKGATGFGSLVDVYEVVRPVPVKPAGQAVNKHYMFDSGTGLLSRVTYLAPSGTSTVLIQTVLSNYSAVGAYSLPGNISRIVGGIQVLSFTRAGATVSGAAPAAVFAVSGGH